MNSTGHSNNEIAAWLGGLGQIALLGKESLASLLTFKVVWRDLRYQIYCIGVKSQSLGPINGAFTGMVVAARLLHDEKMASNVPALMNNLSLTSINLNRVGLWGFLRKQKQPLPANPPKARIPGGYAP